MGLVDILPPLNATLNAIEALIAEEDATLNATSAALVILGYRAIRSGDRDVHKRRMLAAFGASALFLACYLLRWALTGTHRFVGPGWLRATYLVILMTHMLLAAAVVPLVLRTLWLGLKGRVDAHRRIARWTLPIWLYVSVTGVVVYVMLYHLSA